MKIENLDKYNTEKRNFKKDIINDSLRFLDIDTTNEDNKELVLMCADNNLHIYDYETLVDFIDNNYVDKSITDNQYYEFNFDSFIRDCIYGSELTYHNMDNKERDLFNKEWLQRTFYLFISDISNFEYELDMCDFE